MVQLHNQYHSAEDRVAVDEGRSGYNRNPPRLLGDLVVFRRCLHLHR